MYRSKNEYTFCRLLKKIRHCLKNYRNTANDYVFMPYEINNIYDFCRSIIEI